jgi:peptidoglycan/xylan/chitin deacetylase (PgdA/CDA1 family)
MSSLAKLIVFFFFIFNNVFIYIEANKKKTSMIQAHNTGSKEKYLLKSSKQLKSISKTNGEISNSPFSGEISCSSSDDFLKNKNSKKTSDSSHVLDASKKFALPSVIQRCINNGDIALTFDDGVGKSTKDVLEILQSEGVKATFFVLGNTLDSSIIGEIFANRTLHQMLEDGHTIASHSYSHPNFDEYWPEGISHEMERAKNLFIKHVGVAPRFMRPPFGNATPRTIQSLHSLGYFIIGWNVDTNDWMHAGAPEKSLKDFTSKLPNSDLIDSIRFQKGGLTDLGMKTMINNILESKIALMHDIHPSIVHFLPPLIKQARKLGYRFVNMEDCLGGINPYFAQ